MICSYFYQYYFIAFIHDLELLYFRKLFGVNYLLNSLNNIIFVKILI